LIPGDPNVQLVELVAAALGDLREELVLVGGCAASLLIEASSRRSKPHGPIFGSIWSNLLLPL
jgi:hypothetical protein